MNSVHASEVSEGYRPPKKVADEIVKAALSKIPGAQGMIQKINNKPKLMNILNGLTPHQYHSNGTLQFGGFG